MDEYIEFRDSDVPDKNPNASNDAFKFCGSVSVDMFFVFMLSLPTIPLVLSRIGILSLSKREDKTMIIGMIYVALIARSFWKEKYFKRKKIFKNSVSYPGVIINVNEYKVVDAKHTNITYEMEIKYQEGLKVIGGYDADPRKYLENPYCTLYKGEKRFIAADFKVRSQYLTSRGKFKYK